MSVRIITCAFFVNFRNVFFRSGYVIIIQEPAIDANETRRFQMDKYIPKEKMSKKARKAQNLKKRVTWQGFNPVTRKPPNPKAYKRKKLRYQDYPDSEASFIIRFLFRFSRLNCESRLLCGFCPRA